MPKFLFLHPTRVKQ